MNLDKNLTELFYLPKAANNESVKKCLDVLLNEANSKVKGGYLYASAESDDSIIIQSKITLTSEGFERSDIKKTALYLALTARGNAMVLNEVGCKKDISQFVAVVVGDTLSSLMLKNNIARYIKAEPIEKFVLNELNKVKNYADYDECRLDLITNTLDQNFWQRICETAFDDVIKKLDAQALRVAMSLNFNLA